MSEAAEMKMIEILEVVASNSHYHVSVEKLIESQPQHIKNAFANNEFTALRKHLSQQKKHPDKDTVFFLKS